MSRLLDTVFSYPLRSLFYVFMALPLVYIPGHHIYARGLRISFVIFIAIASCLMPILYREVVKNFGRMHPIAQRILIIIIGLMCLSILFSKLDFGLLLFGREPDYLGILGWLSIVMFGLLLADNLNRLLFSQAVQRIVGAVLIISLVMGSAAVIGGYRMPGLMMQATTMGMYAVLALIVSLHQFIAKAKSPMQKYESLIVVLLSITSVIFTQSRISYLALVLVLTYFAYKYVNRRAIVFVMITVSCVVSIIALISTEYFSRLEVASVGRGVTYRMHIYQTVAGEALKHNIIVGNGPGVLPIYLNNVDFVPEDIAKTLNEGLIFISAHDLFLDFALYFGVVAALLLLGLCLWVLINNVDSKVKRSIDSPPTKLYFTVLMLNATCNTISPEILTLTIAVLFSLLLTPTGQKKSGDVG